jgi:multiple sugar transport system permease protein
VVSSLIIALGTAVLTLAIAIPAAHALARYRFRVTALLVGSLLVAQILPSIVIANSLFLVYHRLHLLNSYPGLIIADASYAVPFGILVLRAFMLALPRDVIAAARVDGASEWRAFTRIVLPMSRSAIITIALFAFLNGWGDFIFALTLLNGNTFEPVTLSIYTYVGEFSQNWGEAMALAVFALLPAAMLLIAAQRYIAAGLTVGSVKGLPHRHRRQSCGQSSGQEDKSGAPSWSRARPCWRSRPPPAHRVRPPAPAAAGAAATPRSPSPSSTTSPQAALTPVFISAAARGRSPTAPRSPGRRASSSPAPTTTR